jgi:hypothetical protein
VRGLIVALVLVASIASGAQAEPLPPGSIGVIFGAVAGINEDHERLGYGYNQFGAQAGWQPMSTERRIGYGLRWSFLFGRMYGADGTNGAARIDPFLRTLTMDFSAGIRVRPGVNPSRYITLRGGIEMFRSNQEIPMTGSRVFIGPAASIGIDQYIAGLLFNLDVHYGIIGSGPGEISILIGGAIAGP